MYLPPLAPEEVLIVEVTQRGMRAPIFCVSSIAGVKVNDESGSAETGTRGLEIMIADTAAMRVNRTSCMKRLVSRGNMESTIRRATPIMLFQNPPIRESGEGCSLRNVWSESLYSSHSFNIVSRSHVSFEISHNRAVPCMVTGGQMLKT